MGCNPVRVGLKKGQRKSAPERSLSRRIVCPKIMPQSLSNVFSDMHRVFLVCVFILESEWAPTIGTSQYGALLMGTVLSG